MIGTDAILFPTLSDVLTVIEVAGMLRVHPVTVRLGAAAGKIPGRQIGNRWRFSRAVIESWLGNKEMASD